MRILGSGKQEEKASLMSTTELKLDTPGTLARPGPVGRLVRLAFGAWCLYYVLGLLNFQDQLLTNTGTIRPYLWNGILPGLFLISYVVNIGYSRAWKKWPAVASAGLLIGAAGISQITEGAYESTLFAGILFAWLVYLFTHLGSAFVLSALLSTPGCELRAFHDLFGRLTGRAAMEHYCPVGPLNPIDRWEAKQGWSR